MRRTQRPFEPAATPRLLRRRSGERVEWWTETAGHPPPVYGERWASLGTRTVRAFDPARSKLAAGLARGYAGPLPRPGETWLYLGAASGTTPSHLADLVGPTGSVFAVEKSPRPFARLLAVAERWPNLLPLLDDARAPETYADLVPTVDGIYADVAQPDQAGILLENARYFLEPARGIFLLALKTPSLGRDRAPAGHLVEAEKKLGGSFLLERPVRLEPFHRGHYLVGGRRTDRLPRRSATPRDPHDPGPARPSRWRPRAFPGRTRPPRGPPRGRRRR